jgi:hypothetical protein
LTGEHVEEVVVGDDGDGLGGPAGGGGGGPAGGPGRSASELEGANA